MIRFMKLQYHYLFPSKMIFITYGVIAIAFSGFLLLSSCFLPVQELLFHQSLYRQDYYLDGLNFLKLITVIYSMFLVINGYVLHHYDFYLILRSKKKNTVFISKMLVLLLGNVVFISYCFFLFLFIPLFLTPYFHFELKLVALYGKMILFGNYYLLLYILIYTIANNIYSLVMVISAYFLSSLTTEYFLEKADIQTVAKIMNLLFVDLAYYLPDGFDFYYGPLFTFILSIGIFQIIVLLSHKNDILN